MKQFHPWLKCLLIFPFWVCCLTACVNQEQVFLSKEKLMLAEQHPNDHLEHEVMVAQISELLLVKGLKKEERAILHFERGVLYDSLGLWALARYDFDQTLALYPKLAAAFNYLGLYLLLEEDYSASLDIFNVLFELDPQYEYAFLNRGLNFYYVGRYELAQRDFLQFYQADKSDPYRTLWLYLNELNHNPQDASKNLAQRAMGLSDEYWGTYLVQYYLGKLSVNALFAQAEEFAQTHRTKYAEILTETYFYLAKLKLNSGQINEAETLFKLAIANQVYNFVEYRFALFELLKLKQSSKP
ncbi:TPA: lipoprotein NlpI [Pasteurella multocida]|uniref:lipoprotein NlpI n=1 Tax=Pasteurella multocida TaxID=747 RepID=UPI0012EA9B99|nr:lipoprotein NlpI [Pasteurella multocida]MEB3469390.1 lipoprotein NlpI [Pasteurella multocida]NNH92230.1 lipoprotein NlpI [Pasteurella multocida]QGV28128.1 lipoprotein NlpI [Pasteurella multocida]WND42042.1 lipoprotein NlpI [Pasteurella multocida]HDR0633085.1 lipoprotein NlpI [Pasteurella multocida]